MTRHQFSKAHLSAAMLALHATKGSPEADDLILLTAEQEATIADATARLARATGLSVTFLDAEVRGLLKEKAARDSLHGIDMAEVVRLVTAAASPPRPPVARFASFPKKTRSRYRGERHPITSYEHVLVARWPTALDGGDRATNSAEFSVVASKLGATDEEILAMIATVNARPSR